MKHLESFLLYFVLFFLPIGQLLEFSLTPSIHLYLIDIVVFLLISVWMIKKLLRKQPFSAPPLAQFILAFAAVTLVSLLFSFIHFSPLQVGIGSLYLFRWICYTGVYFVVYEYKNKQRLLTALMISGVVSAVFGLFQYFLYPNLRNLLYLGWDPHEYRVFGTYFDSGFAAVIYLLTLILIVYFYTENLVKNKLWLVLAGLATYVAFALTYARSSYLAFLAAFFILSILKKNYKFALLSILILGITVILLPRPSQTSEGVKLTRTSTISARETNYLQTLQIIEDNPVIGIGFNLLRYENSKRGFVSQNEGETNHAAAGSDSSLLFVASTTGIIGLIAYILFWYQMVRLELNKGKTDHFLLFVLPTLGALLVNSLFLNSLFYIWTMLWLWILLGISHGTSNTRFIPRSIASNYLKSIFALR